ncbi:MAG: GNAT family N-acetyltransferase [Pikeienuella sp.]
MIRVACAADAKRASTLLVRSITQLCHADHQGDVAEIDEWTANKTPANLRTWIDNPDLIFLVSETLTGLAGLAAGDKTGAVHLNYVDPDHRFTGVSRALLSMLEAKMAAAGATNGQLTSTLTAKRFYLSQGWNSLPCDAPDTIHGAKMHKTLIFQP